MKRKKKDSVKKIRLPKSTRPNQVHKTAKDYDRKDAWKDEQREAD